MGIIDGVLVGEASAGDGSELARVELVLGPRGSSAEMAFCQAFAGGDGAAAALAIISPDITCRPYTVVLNKTVFTDVGKGAELFSLVQCTIAMAVMDCVEDGIIPVEEVEGLFLCVGVFIREQAENESKLRNNFYEAVKSAIKRALAHEPKVSEILTKRESLRPALRVYS